ncbi:hypothetical protein niasHT_029211 [Heterodera trifolii]|uniref:Uncharacterized protein n=1 Tax=Heterodera trifolii TaxID=157864 RepID=A0ABD2K090_9BILA
MDSFDSLLKSAPRHVEAKSTDRECVRKGSRPKQSIFFGWAPAKSFLTRLDSAHSPDPSKFAEFFHANDVGSKLTAFARKTNGKSPRSMLIGNPQWLFDEGELAADLEERGEAQFWKNSSRVIDRMVRTHYVMYDNDRLMWSTDCHELFGRVADESCESEKEMDGKGRTDSCWWLK